MLYRCPPMMTRLRAPALGARITVFVTASLILGMLISFRSQPEYLDPLEAGPPELLGQSVSTEVLTQSFDPPIRITKGGTYSGNWKSTDPNVPAVMIYTDEPVTIENSIITGPGHLVSTDFHTTTDLTVRNTYGYGQNPDERGRPPGRFLHIEMFSKLIVENNYLEDTMGIYAHRWVGGGTVKILFNRAFNIVGLWSDGDGSWLRGENQFSYAQFVQLNSVHGVSDAEIAWNEVINLPGQSRTEDVINIFDSSGTPASPISIHDNFIRGSYPADPRTQSFSGGGILLGDGGGGYQVAFHNQVINVGNYGIAIAGGTNNRIARNRVVSAGILKDGTRIASANVGMYIWNQYGQPFGNNTGTENVVGYIQWGSGDNAIRNDWWVPDASSWNHNMRLDGPVDLEAERAEADRWAEKVRTANVRIGAG